MSDQPQPQPLTTDPARADRFGALGGIGFTILSLTAAFSVPLSPAADDPASEIRDYVVDNKTALGVSTVLYAAAMLAFVGFLAMVHRRLSASGRNPIAAGTFLIAGTACVALGLLGVLVEAAVVQRIAPGADEAAIAAWYQVWDLVAFTGPPLAVGLALGVAAFVMYRDRSFPRWLALVAAASVVLSAVGLVIDLAGDGVVPVALDLGGFLLANVWIVGLSVTVLLRSRAGAVEPAAAGPATSARPVTA
jgi:hypothetical protein